MDEDDAPKQEAMRVINPAQRRKPMRDDKKPPRKEALTLTPRTSTAYSTPGYYVTDRFGGAQDGPFDTYSLAIANLNGRDGIQYMDQAETAPLNEPFPPGMNTVFGSKNLNKESAMHREAELLQAMANSPADAPMLMAELERIRSEARMEREAAEEIDLGGAYVQAAMTPVPTHSHHTSATDWIAGLEAQGDTASLLTSAALWYRKLSHEVIADRDEFLAQADGMARREASRHVDPSGAYEMWMEHVARIRSTANVEPLLPWSAVEPPVEPSLPLGAEYNTNAILTPGNTGQPQPLSNDAEHWPASTGQTPEDLAAASAPNYFYPNADATAEPNDDGLLKSSVWDHFALELGEDPNPSWPIGGQVLTQPYPINAPGSIEEASSPANANTLPNQDATPEPNDDGALSGALRGITASDSDAEIVRMKEEIAKGEERKKQRNHPDSRTASERFSYPRSDYDAYTKRIAEGSAVVPREFWDGMAAAVAAPVDPRIITAKTAREDLLPIPHVRVVPRPDKGRYDVWHVWSPTGVMTLSQHSGAGEAEEAAKSFSKELGARHIPLGYQKNADFSDPTGSQIGHNPPAWNYGPEDKEEAYEQSGNAQSGLPYAPEGQMAETFSNLTEFPNTGPTKTKRPAWIAARKEDGTETGGRGDVPGAYQPDRGLYAQSPQGQADSTEGYEHAYSSGRPINWTDTGESTLGTVPVEGYEYNADHPHGEMWDWELDSPQDGAANVAGTPTPGAENGYPQPR